MKIRFWGTRGSIPKASGGVLRHGGNTSCVELRSAAGTLVVIDCGSGAQDLGEALMREAKGPVRGALVISHTHWDHIQGLPFFTPLFVPGNEWQIYAPRGLGGSLRDTLAGQMQYDYFPITLEAMGARIEFHELTEGSFAINDIAVSTQYLDHPALTLGYRFEADGLTVVYACDHEPVARKPVPDATDLLGAERRHVEFLKDADVVIHDAQYTATEYPARIGWGHSTHEYAAAVCRAAGVRRLLLTHHDPRRSDDDLDAITARIRAQFADSGPEIEAAREGPIIDLGSAARPRRAAGDGAAASAEAGLGSAMLAGRVALAALSPEVAEVIRGALEAERLPAVPLAAAASGPQPALVILDADADSGPADAAWRAAGEGVAEEGPAVLLVGRGEAPPEGVAGAGSQWMRWPFSMQYARTRIRAAVLRHQCRWVRAALPPNEAERLGALRHLAILDTPREERFDRITRMMSAAFDVPVALVSLMDSDRQWFKSCFGADLHETSREVAFCAHTIVEDAPMLVPDTLLDPRFADNPMVTGGPRLRFYAGCPLRSPDGHVIGTACILDVTPRVLDERRVALLADFGRLVEVELRAGASD